VLFDVRPDLFGLGAVEVLEDSLLSIKVENGLGVVGEHLQPVPHTLRLVVLPLDQVLASHVVLAGHLGRVEQGVVDPAGSGMKPTVLDPIDDGLEGNVKVDNDVDRRLGLECGCLGLRPGKPVQEPRLASHGLQLGGDESDHGRVRHQIALVDELLGLQTQRRSSVQVVAEQISGTDVLEAKVPDDPVGDGALAGTGRTDDQGAHRLAGRLERGKAAAQESGTACQQLAQQAVSCQDDVSHLDGISHRR